MTPETQRWLQVIRPIVDHHFDQLRYARAVSLARAGHYLEAEGLLMPHGAMPATAGELDLLARIAARQGRFTSARRLWLAALEYAPDEAEYVECLQDLDLAERRRRARMTLGLAIIWGVSVVLIGLLALPHFKQKQKPSAVTQSPGISTNGAGIPAPRPAALPARTER